MSPVDHEHRARHDGARLRWVAALLLTTIALAGTAHAQDLEPRAYANTPVGINFLGLGYNYSTGGVSTDPAVPLDNAEIDVHGMFASYGRSFALFGQSAKAGLVLPYAWLSGSADLSGAPVKREVDGLVDPVLKFTTNVLGAPAQSLQDYPAYRQNWIVGVSLAISLPLGQYDHERVVNLGTNRWSFKPELGVSKRWGPLTLEAAVNVKIFTDNERFYGEHRREQDPLYAFRGHLIYAFERGTWVSFDATWYGGGSTSIDGKKNDDRQSNSRIGATLSQPLSRNFSVQIMASTGTSDRTGSDFDTVGAGVSYRWGGGL